MMGPYCRFCDRRCFLPRVLADGQPTLLATCPAGMEHDRRATGEDHGTARNPTLEPDPRPSELAVAAAVAVVQEATSGDTLRRPATSGDAPAADL